MCHQLPNRRLGEQARLCTKCVYYLGEQLRHTEKCATPFLQRFGSKRARIWEASTADPKCKHVQCAGQVSYTALDAGEDRSQTQHDRRTDSCIGILGGGASGTKSVSSSAPWGRRKHTASQPPEASWDPPRNANTGVKAKHIQVMANGPWR